MNQFALFCWVLLVPILCAAAPPSGAGTDAAIPDVPAPSLYHGAIGLGTWNTTAEFKDIVVTSSNGVVLYRSDSNKEGTEGLTVLSGTWNVKAGVFRQTAMLPECRLFVGETNWSNYTLTLRARKTAGQEGFIVYFNCLDVKNWTWFNVGGWTNTRASIDRPSPQAYLPMCDRVLRSVENNVWYEVKVVLNGARIDCYLNSNLVQTAVYAKPEPNISVAAGDSAVAAAPEKKKRSGLFSGFSPVCRGAIGVGCWDTQVEFSNLVVVSSNEVLYRSDFNKDDIENWHTVSDGWVITNGVLKQTQGSFNCFAAIGNTNWANYTLTFRARKTGGTEGFFAIFGWQDENNFSWLNVGGWGNRSEAIEQRILGHDEAITTMNPSTIETGTWYDAKVVLSGAEISCYLNSNLVQTTGVHLKFSTNAVYLGSSRTSDGHALRFRVGEQEFSAGLTKDHGGPPAIEAGSLVQVTGQWDPDATVAAPGSSAECDLELLSPDDVDLLRAPSWWTAQRLCAIGGGFLAVLLTAATWITMISRKNRLLTLAQHELQKANDELELRVNARTADLKHEQELFRTLLDTASDYIYFKDTQSKFVRCSVSLCQRSGFSHAQIVGKTDADIFQQEHARQAFADEQEIIRTGRPLIAKLEKEVHADNSVTWVMTTKMPWRNPAGEIIGTLGISRDITSIKETEDQLEKAHKQLVTASHAAGMAEVAVGVLHNVGNVLNSVNVSTTWLVDRLRKSKVESVGRLAALINDHAADLGDFITKDPRGQRLPQYLLDLSAQLTLEQTEALEELANLRKNVDHIKEIVVMQQNYATISGVNTIVKLNELLEDVLRLTDSGLKHHGIKLVKEFEPTLPEINVDRHKVLQILVNLVRNAKHACQDSPRPDKQLTVRATATAEQVTISVTDNGVGIPAENLTRIFAHGFTTRKDGHGFGLHSSALAAREIGGKLRAESDGPGCGATFTLELSRNPKLDGRLHGIPA